MAIVVATLIMLVVCCLQFWVGMGEELGWMGYLFPRLEQLCGTSVALILMGSVLVWPTKASKSVLPASLIHVMTNALPGGIAAFMILDESVYSSDFSGVGLFTMLPGVIVGVICYIVLLNKYRVEK